VGKKQSTEKEMSRAGWKSPFEVVKKKFGVFFSYIIMLLIACFCVGIQFLPSLFTAEGYSSASALNSTLRSGSYYLIIVPLLGASLVQILDRWKRKDLPPVFSELKLVIFSSGLVIIILSSTSVAFEVLLPSQSIVEGAQQYNLLPRDWIQFGLFGMGILIAIYSFLLVTYEEEYDQLASDTDERKAILNAEASTASDDGRGMTL